MSTRRSNSGFFKMDWQLEALHFSYNFYKLTYMVWKWVNKEGKPRLKTCM